MGVTCVISYPVPEGQSGQQTVDALVKRVEDMGAVKAGNFHVECDSYMSAQNLQQQRVVHVLYNSEQPVSSFAVLDTGTCLIADITFSMIMGKMKDFYSPKKNLKVESKGPRYEMGDFVIKIGSVVLGANSSFKGILVEVEYCPCVVPQQCWALLQEFMQGFLGGAAESAPQHLKNRKREMFGPGDTVLQYLEHFNIMRKGAQGQR